MVYYAHFLVVQKKLPFPFFLLLAPVVQVFIFSAEVKLIIFINFIPSHLGLYGWSNGRLLNVSPLKGKLKSEMSPSGPNSLSRYRLIQLSKEKWVWSESMKLENLANPVSENTMSFNWSRAMGGLPDFLLISWRTNFSTSLRSLCLFSGMFTSSTKSSWNSRSVSARSKQIVGKE